MVDGKKPEILIVGAGPTGLTLAVLLAKMGVAFRIIDENPGPSRNSKAFAIQARTLEIFSQLGIAEKALKIGRTDNTVYLMVKNKVAFKFRVTEVLPGETNYPYLLMLEQDKTEQLLVEQLSEMGNEILWEHKLIGFKESNGFYNANVVSPSGEVGLECSYIIGCDGAGSTVRKTAEIDFIGKTFSPTFFLADCELEWELSHGSICFMLADDYMSGVFSFQENDRYRVFNFINPVMDEPSGDELSAGEIHEILASNSHVHLKAKNIDWTSAFKIHARYSEKFRKGNVFLAGDAAHVHSPAAGQGMNTGIQDAYNLAWKLGLVIKGAASEKLLDTYNEERHPIALNLHRTTDRFFNFMIQKKPIFNFVRMYIVPFMLKWVFSIKYFREQNLRRASQIAIRYSNSSLNRQGNSTNFNYKAPKPGDRAPHCNIEFNGEVIPLFSLFKCTHFSIIIAVSDQSHKSVEEFGKLKHLAVPVNVFTIQKSSKTGSFFKTYGVNKEAVFVVRPDGHICFRSSNLDAAEVERYFKEVLKHENIAEM